MYTPGAFRQSDQAEILQLIRSYPFATVITWDESGPFVNHLPVLFDESSSSGLLIGHLARANPQTRHFQEEREALVVFNGPHSYVSPTWYAGKEQVPTWNYAVAHVRGKSRAVSQARLLQILELSVGRFEKGEASYRFSQNPDLKPEFKARMMNAIVGFEIEMSQVDAKFKLSQNREEEDYDGVLLALESRNDDMSRALLELMRRRNR